MADDSLIFVRERNLDFPVFDADNHLYENTRRAHQVPAAGVRGRVKYIEVDGRTKLAIRDHISEYIPNPTFQGAGLARPGGRSKDDPARSRRAMPGIDAFFDPEPRLELMKDMGIDRTLLWPTLASVLEERVADDPDVAAP